MPDRYNVGIIGTRFSEAVQIPAFQQHPSFKVVAIGGRDPDHTREVAKKFSIERSYTDWRQLIASGDLDLISIVTPPHLHCEISLAAFDKGLHVLCEKPMALNAGEAKQMLDRSKETGLTAMIDHELRYLSINQRFGELIQNGYIGKLRRLIIRAHQSWRSFAEANPASTWDWWGDSKKGGGYLGAAGSHLFDALQHWFCLPKRVWGKLSTFTSERPANDSKGIRIVTADDSFLAVLDLGNDMEVLFDCTVIARPTTGVNITALGSEGTLVIENGERLLGSKSDEKLQPFDIAGPSRVTFDPRIAPFLCLLDDLAKGISQGFSPAPNFEDGVAHQQFIDSVKISSALGTWVDFPPSIPVPEGVLP